MKTLNTLFGYPKSLSVTVMVIIAIAVAIRFSLFGIHLFDDNQVIVPIFLGVAGFIWNIALVTKLPALTHYSQAHLIPDYHQVIGKQAKLMMLAPLAPMLILSPDFSMMLGAMAMMLALNLLMLIAMYKPLVLILVVILFVVGLDISVMLNIDFDSNMFIYSLLPPILIIVNGVIDRLPKFNVSQRQLNLMKASVNKSNQAAFGLFIMPNNKQELANPIQSWIANFNLTFYSRALAKKSLPNFKLIELALLTKTTMGPFNYLLIFTFALIGFIAITLTGLGSNTSFIVGLSCGLIGGFFISTTLVLLNDLMRRKPYIAQLFLSPLYQARQKLRMDFAYYVLWKAVVAALGGVAILLLLSSGIASISAEIMVFNTVLVFACFAGSSGLVLIALHQSKRVHWSMNFVLILMMLVFAIGVGLTELTDPSFEKTVRIVYLSTVLGFSFASLFVGINFWRTQEPIWEGDSSGLAKA